MRQLILDLLPEAPPAFDNFVAGSNADALTGLVAWLAPESREPSLLLWGAAGSGKTHLLRASSACFTDACCNPDLSNIDETAPFHAVDNVEALSATGQVALFNLFNRLRATSGRLLTSASQPPLHLVLREDLRTRLGSGLIYRLHGLTDQDMLAALASLASARGLRMPPGGLDYLLARAPRDMRSLAALLMALDHYSLEHKRPITLPLLREVLLTPLT